MRGLIFLAIAVAIHALLITAQGAGRSIPLDLSSAFNAKAASTGLNDTFADFDGSGRAFPVEFLPSESSFTFDGIKFALPPFHNATAYDTVRSASQVIRVDESGEFQSLHALASAVWPPSSSALARVGNVTFAFAGGSQFTASIIVGPWYSDSPFNGPIHTPWHYANGSLEYNNTVDHNITHILYATMRVPSALPLVSITLPEPDTYINWFSITLRSASSSLPSVPVLGVQSVRSTTKWFDSELPSTDSIQIIEVRLDNLAPLDGTTDSWIRTPYNVSISSSDSSLITVVPATLKRLRSNDQALLRVGDQHGHEVYRSEGWEVTAGIPEWVKGDASLATHEAPEWYDDAKFGIFIHWGVYWSQRGHHLDSSMRSGRPTSAFLTYAALAVIRYNWQLHNPPDADSPTWVHHLQTYGPDVIYDDFIANFTAEAWDPDEWTDLFADAVRATLSSSRSITMVLHCSTWELVAQKCDRDGAKTGYSQELFDSAKTRHPELHRGTYYSMPEWFNPDYAPYARTDFPGQPALYAFNHSCCEPYFGHIPVDNYLEDLQRPQIEKLFYEYDTDILWCDEDGASAFSEIAPAWYNYAAAQGRQSLGTTDLSQKWESSAGMDPFSYGYNSNTSADAYMNASEIIVELVDIVSKGGNFLLDIGPKADGTVIPEESGPLLQVGTWLRTSGDAIYSTRPWFVQSADSTQGIRTPEGGVLNVKAPVPVLEGDTVRMLGGSQDRWLERECGGREL
ncbi:Alpha-L-fucosidase [Grifola frondosa]|uniref:alpha-L-fucosidase n=1 Tax=Grifola frondosa TaxID=5627 RepID=A0A1C7M857_GRIFR|nr:Alpha-L-fucosidase [Grifola frondosa]